MQRRKGGLDRISLFFEAGDDPPEAAAVYSRGPLCSGRRSLASFLRVGPARMLLWV